jgi:CheY-like chemotaxis protein
MARILVVDDSELARRMIGDLLTRNGHDVTGAPDGDAALSYMRETTFDLLITDFMMPGMLGDELVRRVHEATPDLPVVVISSYTDSDLFRAVRALPVARIINKPFADADILGAVGDLLPDDA